MRLVSIAESRLSRITGTTTSRNNKILRNTSAKVPKYCSICKGEIGYSDLYVPYFGGGGEQLRYHKTSGASDHYYFHPECIEKHFETPEYKAEADEHAEFVKRNREQQAKQDVEHKAFFGSKPKRRKRKVSHPTPPTPTPKRSYEATVRQQIQDRSPTSLRGGSWSSKVQRNRRLDA